uniref:ubiquitinyl hydrolase 1 n=1 Tax=Caenorhabditis tropicalis TaxID=1561998 RepID=A0A1I7U4Y9_9PELO
MPDENEKKPRERPNTRKLAFRNEAIQELLKIDEHDVTFQKAMEVAKLDCKRCLYHETTHNPKSSNCRDNPFCINRLGLEKFEKLITLENETKEEAKKDQKRRDLNDRPAGLINGGNYCYVNSFLQVWFNIPEFRQLVFDFRPDPNFVPPPDTRMDVQAVMLALQDIYYTLQTTPFNESNKTANLVKLLRLNTEQQDSQEFGVKFFNALERCLADHPNGREIATRMTELFTGSACTTISCECGYRSKTAEITTSLQLIIEGHTTLLDALDYHCRLESLDDYICPGCNKKGNSSRQTDFVKLPTVIVIQLMRYKFTPKGRQKLKSPLAYPREIPASAFQRTDFTTPPPAEMYDLMAVTIHEGNNAECGHYYDLIKSPLNQKWNRYNDENVEALAKAPGTDRPTSAAKNDRKKKDKEKYPADHKACYGLFYRRRDASLPLPHPVLPPEELILESKNEIEEMFEGMTKKKIEKSEKRLYDLQRRIAKLKTTYTNLETHADKYNNPNEIAFLPTSLLLDVLNQEYEVAKGEKKKKKKEPKEEKPKQTTEEEDIAAAIAASEADQLAVAVAASSEPSTSTADEEEEAAEVPNPEVSAADTSLDAEELTPTTPTKEIDILAIAMEESALPVEPSKMRTRQQNGDVKYVYSTRSPRKNPSTTMPVVSPQKQPVSSRVGALLGSHEIPICGHGKMSIDSILFGDVKAVSRAPAISILREYDYRVKLVYDSGETVYPPPEKDRELFIFTAEDICMDCIKEMRQEGIFNNQLEEDDKMVRKIVKEEKQRCSVKCQTPRPEGHVYVAKFALSNFRKAAIAVREAKLAESHGLKGTLLIDSVTQQRGDSNYPASLKRPRGRQPKTSEVPEKLQKMNDGSSSVMEEEEPTLPVDTLDPDTLQKPQEHVEFNAELRCTHGGINYSQFRHSVSPEEWSRLAVYFDECFEVKCSENVCDECRQMEVDAQHGSDNMRQLVREMRRRINDTLKAVESRGEEEESIRYGICSAFIEKLKRLSNRQSTSPPTICQECLLCQHQLPFKGFLNSENPKDPHVIGVTEEEWNTFVVEIRNLEEAGDEHAQLADPHPIHIENGRIRDLCDRCHEQHIKFTEEQKYMFDNENIYVKLVNPVDEDDVQKANGKARRGRAKNMYSIKMSSSSKLMELKVQLYDKTHQLPNDQLLYRTVGGECLDVAQNQKTLFELRIAPNNNDNPLILIAQQFTASTQSDETGDRAPERGFDDTALGH